MTRLVCALFAVLICLVSGAAFAAEAERRGTQYVSGQAIAMLRVPEEIRRDERRRALFAACCREVAKEADAEVVYISPVYESSEYVTAVFSSKLETEELLARLRQDCRVLSATPNYLMKLPRPPKTDDAQN